jgi:iron(III) transport system ATP-binding protein
LKHVVPSRGGKTGRGLLAVRPSAITIEPAEVAAFAGRISHVAYLGDHIEYEAETSGGTLFIVDPSVDRPLAPGTQVALGLKSRGVAIIAG